MTARRRLRTRYQPDTETHLPAHVPEVEAPPRPSSAHDASAAADAPAEADLGDSLAPPAEGNATPEAAPVFHELGIDDLLGDGAAHAEIHDAHDAAPPPEESVAAPAAPAPAPILVPVPVRKRHRIAGFFLMLGLALVAFATGVLVFNGLVMPRLIHGIGEVVVPDVRNLTLEQAEQALRSANLQLSREGERFDPGVPRGFVLSQDPPPGTSVRGRRRVSVVVSLGEEYSSVPELFGESQRTAEQLVRSAGLQLGAITRAPSDQVGEGLVVGSDPGPETVLPQGSIVSLLVSTGAGEENYVMPDLLGREIAGVRRQLEALGFKIMAPPGSGSLGTIVAQRPAAGSRITRADVITLQASRRMIR